MIKKINSFFVRLFLFCYNYFNFFKKNSIIALHKYIEGSNEGNNIFFSIFQKHILNTIETTPYLLYDNYVHIEKTIALVRLLKLPPQNVLLDVGGFHGDVAVKFAKAFPNARVLTFEPIQKHFEILQNNIKPYSNIESFNVALGDINEEKSINKLVNSASSSILEVADKIENNFFSENLAPDQVEPILVKKLDDIIAPNLFVNILKIDVQGFELHVLNGGIDTLNHVFVVLIELQNHRFYKGAPLYYEIDEFLRKHGFELYEIMPAIHQEMKLYEWDALYTNTALLKTL